AAVEADVHAEAQPAEVVDGERPVARVGEPVGPEARQVNLAVGGDEPARPDERAGVEELAARRRFEQAEDGPHAAAAALAGGGVRRGAGQRLGGGAGLLPRLEPVAGQGALGEDDEPRPAAGGP